MGGVVWARSVEGTSGMAEVASLCVGVRGEWAHPLCTSQSVPTAACVGLQAQGFEMPHVEEHFPL